MESFEEFKESMIKKALANMRPAAQGSLYRTTGFVSDVFDTVYPEIVARAKQEAAKKPRSRRGEPKDE